MAKISYNIKANIREASKNIQELIKQANQLRAAMQRVSQIGERTPLNTNLLNALTKAERQIESLNKALDFTKKQFADVGSLKGGLSSIATDNIAKSTNAILRDAEKLEQRLNRIEERSKKAREDIRQAERKSSNSDMVTPFSGGGYSRSKQLELLRKQAEEVYNAYYKTDPKRYRAEMNNLREGYDRIRAELKEINSVADESFNTIGKISSAMSSVRNRFAFLASRAVALFGLEVLGESVKNIVGIEQGMAGFEQVMAKGEHATNLFGKSLVDAHPEKFTEGLSHATAEAEVYSEQLQEMQNKLLSLAVKYGSTSEEVIESAKLWGRAYKDNNVVLALTDAATKLAIADAFDIVTANKALESSIMQWGFEIENTNDAISVSNRIIDSWTALSHNYTVSANTLVEANRRMAQSAKVVGVGFHEAQALISVMARKTMADGGEIGNALKSIFGSIHSAKAIKALQDFGVEVYQIGENGEKSFRRVDAVLTDLMIKAQTTNANMEDLLKSISGGKWQWNKAGAMLDLTEYLKALTISTTAYGFTNEQVGMQLETVSKKMQSVRSELDKLMAEGGSANTVIKGILTVILDLLKWVDRIPIAFFEVVAALTAVRLAWRMFSNQAIKNNWSVKGSIDAMTAAVNRYTASVMSAPTFMGKVGKGVGGIFNGLVGALGKANVAITLVLGALGAVEYAMTKEMNSVKDSIEQHDKFIQVYQEQYDRLSEAEPTLESLVSAYNQLTDAIAQEGEGTENANKLDAQRNLVKQGIINIVGEEASAVIDGSNINQEEQQKMKNALERRRQHLQSVIAHESELYMESADNLRNMVQSDIDALNDESIGWIRLIGLIFKYAGAWDAVKATFWSASEAIHKNKAARLQSEIDDLKAQRAQEIEETGDSDVTELQIQTLQMQVDAANEAAADSASAFDQLKKKADLEATEKLKSELANMDNLIKQVANTSNSAANTGYIGGGGGGNSSGGSRGGGSTATAKENEPIAIQLARRLIEKYHLSPEEAAGILGNAMRESGGDGFDLNPRANNGTHLGIFQWATNGGSGEKNRWENYVDWATANKMDIWNAQNQLDFYMYERDTFEKGYWEDIRNMNPRTPEEWAHAVNLYSERSGDDSYLSGRQGNARDVYEYLRSHPGSGGSYADPAKNEAARLKDIYDKSLAGLDYSADAMKNEYEKALDKIDNKTKITGDTVDTFTERMKVQDDYVTKIKESIESYNKALEETKKQFDDNEKSIFKNTAKMDLDEFYKKSSIEMKKASVDIDKDSLPILNEKLQFVIKLKEQEEKLYKSEQDNIIKSMELRRKSLKEMYDMQVEAKRLEYEIWQEENKGRYIAPWDEGRLRQPYLDGIANSEKERYDRAVADNNKYEGKLYNENELLKMKKGWLDARNAAKEYSRTVSDDVRQKTYDVFHSLIIEGNSIKDVWKKLWQGLAEDALKALFRINDGQMSLFGRLLGGIFGGGGGVSATPHADGGLVESEQLYRIGERGKKEMVVPLERNNPRGKMLVRESARRLGMLETKVEPSFKSPQVQNGTVIKQLVSKQTTNMARMEALTQTMVNILTFMANNQANGAVGGNNVVQPVIVKQTMSDIEFMQHFQKMQRMGKLK